MATRADAYYFVNDGSTATYQLQTVDGAYTKCVKIELTQVGADIQARVLHAKYVSGSQLGYNFDVSGAGNSIATSYGTSGYGAAETTLTTYPTSRLTLSAANSYSGGTVVNDRFLSLLRNVQALRRL